MKCACGAEGIKLAEWAKYWLHQMNQILANRGKEPLHPSEYIKCPDCKEAWKRDLADWAKRWWEEKRMPREKIGALWKRETKGGKRMLTGEVLGQRVVFWENDSDNPKAPAWNGYIDDYEPKPKEKRPAQARPPSRQTSLPTSDGPDDW